MGNIKLNSIKIFKMCSPLLCPIKGHKQLIGGWVGRKGKRETSPICAEVLRGQDLIHTKETNL